MRRAYFAAAYPMVYRTSTAERTMDAALGFDDLSPDQSEMIIDLRDRYAREAERLNAMWVEEIDRAEAGSRIEDLFAGMGFGSDAERQRRRDKRDLDLRYADLVRGALLDEQAARLPEPARLRRFGDGGLEEAPEPDSDGDV